MTLCCTARYITAFIRMALCYNNCLLIVLVVCLSQMLINAKKLESTFVIKSGCAPPDDTITLDCLVRLLRSGNSIVWRGTAFDCPPRNEISFLFKDFVNNGSMAKTCNNGMIVASGHGIDSDNRTYISRLIVTVSSSIVGKNITCEYDNGTVPSPGSVKLIKTENGIHLNISYEVESYERRIIFMWNQLCFGISDQYTYNITSNCGNCPTITNHTTVTCTDVPAEANHCVFVIYGRFLHNTTIDVELRQKRDSKPLGLISAYVLLTITVVILLTLISIALMLRFRGLFKRTFSFLKCDRSISNPDTSNQPKDVQQIATQNEEDSIYSRLHENLEINNRVVKTFDDVENGVYSVLDVAGCQEKVKGAAFSSGVKFQSSDGASALAVYSQVGGSLNVDNLLITFGGKIKSQWQKFGLALGVPRCVLNQLSGEDTQCLKMVLDHWLKHHQGQPTWAEVAEAQKRISNFNDHEDNMYRAGDMLPFKSRCKNN